MYNIVNHKGYYLCVDRDLTKKQWVSPTQLQRRQGEGLLTYRDAGCAIMEQQRSRAPKQVCVGSERMVRPDYPDMRGARAVPAIC